MANLTSAARKSWASISYVDGSSECCSIYKRMVAPEEPVPDSRTTMRLPDEKPAYRPCLEETEPSRSVYEKFPALVTVRPMSVSKC